VSTSGERSTRYDTSAKVTTYQSQSKLISDFAGVQVIVADRAISHTARLFVGIGEAAFESASSSQFAAPGLGGKLRSYILLLRPPASHSIVLSEF